MINVKPQIRQLKKRLNEIEAIEGSWIRAFKKLKSKDHISFLQSIRTEYLNFIKEKNQIYERLDNLKRTDENFMV